MRFVYIAVVAFVMIAGGLGHLLSPEGFAAFVPVGWPTQLILVGTGLLQVLIGLAVLWPRTRGLAALAFALLCAAYVPLHVWDFFRPDPVFKTTVAASVRLAVQFVFIAIGLALWRQTSRRTSHPSSAAA